MGLPRITMKGMEDFCGIMHRLWRETVLGHDGPAGSIPGWLKIQPSRKTSLMLGALGPKTLEFAGRVFDGVILHLFYR